MNVSLARNSRSEGQSISTRRTARRLRWGATCLAVALLGACSAGSGTEDNSFSVESVNAADGAVGSELAARMREEGLTTLASALEVIDVGELIDGAEFTLLAPSDDAFQSMDPDDVADLLADPASLLAVLRNHVIGERLSSEELAAMASITTQTGAELDIVEVNGTLQIGDTNVSSSDLEVDNGTAHVVDRILVP